MADITIPQPGDEVVAEWGATVAQAINAIQSGSISVAGITNTVSGTANVVFPKAYAAAPDVVAICPSEVVIVAVAAVTAAGFTAKARRADGVATSTTQVVTWMAYGVLA